MRCIFTGPLRNWYRLTGSQDSYGGDTYPSTTQLNRCFQLQYQRPLYLIDRNPEVRSDVSPTATSDIRSTYL